VTSLGAKGRPSNLQRICLEELEKAEEILLQTEGFNPQEFKSLFKGKPTDNADILEAFDRQVGGLTKEGRIGYADTFKGSKQSFLRYMADKKKTISTFDEITVAWLESYAKWGAELINTKKGKKRRLSRSSLGIHLRNLRVLHNKALKTGGGENLSISEF